MKMKITWIAMRLVPLTAAFAHGQGLPAARPEKVGSPSERLGRLMTLP